MLVLLSCLIGLLIGWALLHMRSAHSAARAEAPKQLSQAESSLIEADSRRFQAMMEGDIPALKLALADELIYVHSSSTPQTKSEHLADMESGKAVYKLIDAKEQIPSIYGDTGLIQGVAAFIAGRNDSTFTLRYTAVYVKRDRRWQMVAWHCTRIPESQPAH